MTVYAVSYFMKRETFHFSRIYTVMLLFVAANAAAFFAGGNGFADIGKIKNVMCFFGFMIAYEKASVLLDKNLFMFIIQATNAALLLFGIAVHSAGLTSTYLFQDFANWTNQYSGLFSISITYAEYLVMAQIISVSILVFARDSFGSNLKRGFFIAFVAVNFVALVLTYSRGPWLAMAFALVMIFLKMNRRFAVVIVLLMALSFAAILSPPAASVPLVSDVRTRINMTLSGYSSGREVIYAVGMKIIRDHPLFGVGIGGVERLYPEYLKALPDVNENEKKMLLKQHMVFGHLHNAYLQIWAETGIFGLSVFLALIFLATSRVLAGTPAAAAEGVDPAFRFGVFTAIIAMCIMGLTEYNFFHNEISRIFWFYIGMAYAASDGRSRRAGCPAVER